MHEVCPNHEVVVFQPRTLNTPHLGSCCLPLKSNPALLPQLFHISYLYLSFPLFPTASPPVAVPSSNYYCFTRSPPPIPAQSAAHLGAAPHLPPFSLRRSSLLPAPHACVYRRSCAGVIPPFPPSDCTQVPVGPWGVCPSWVPPRLCVPASPSTFVGSNFAIVLNN